MMNRTGLVFQFLMILMTGCGEPESVPLQVGTLDITVIFPSGWEHIDYGQQHQWRHDFQRIAIQDYDGLGSEIELAIARAMVKLLEDGRREIASRDTLQISGRDARMIDTWDHVSHQYRKRYLFVLNQNKLLVLYTMQGQFELMEPAFAELANSLAFIDTTVADGN